MEYAERELLDGLLQKVDEARKQGERARAVGLLERVYALLDADFDPKSPIKEGSSRSSAKPTTARPASLPAFSRTVLV